MSNMTPPNRKHIFIDTSAHYALTDVKDVNHGKASNLIKASAIENSIMFTTNFIIAEVHALIISRLRRTDIALSAIEKIITGGVNIVHVTQEDEDKALDILRSYKDKIFSYTDATSFVVMERLNIPTAFAFDLHFEQYGFVLYG